MPVGRLADRCRSRRRSSAAARCPRATGTCSRSRRACSPASASAPLIELGSAWKARCASESPSTPSSGSSLHKRRPRGARSRPSAGRSPPGPPLRVVARRSRRARSAARRRPAAARAGAARCPRSPPARAGRRPRARSGPLRCAAAPRLLSQPLLAPRPLGEHRRRHRPRGEPDGGLDRLGVPLAAPNRNARRQEERHEDGL